MECASIYTDIDDGPQAFQSKNPKARKEHKCFECGRTIALGETYRNESGIWDDGPKRYKTCCDCITIRNAFFDQGGHYGEMMTELQEHISDLDAQVPSKCLDDLTSNARNTIFTMMDKHILSAGA